MYDSSYSKAGKKFINKDFKLSGYYVDSTSGKNGKHPSYESHGLQASLIKVNGQYVVAARGTSGAGDAKQDFDLTDPDAYQEESQFKDFQQFIEKMHRLHPDFDPQKATYTGHSLGAALATYAAVHYDAKATVFSAPRAYNELTPQQRAQVRQGKFNKKIKNIKHANGVNK